jgi:hypothetical protein
MTTGGITLMRLYDLSITCFPETLFVAGFRPD